jgi:hypothetical protein
LHNERSLEAIKDIVHSHVLYKRIKDIRMDYGGRLDLELAPRAADSRLFFARSFSDELIRGPANVVAYPQLTSSGLGSTRNALLFVPYQTKPPAHS